MILVPGGAMVNKGYRVRLTALRDHDRQGLSHPFLTVLHMNNFSSHHDAEPMAAVLRHPSAARRLSTPIEHIRDQATVSSLGTSAFALHDDSDLDAELRLREAVSRRHGQQMAPQRRVVTISARGPLLDGRLFWTGAEGTWGVIEPLLAEMMGWDATTSRSVRAVVHSGNGRHQVLEIHTLVPV